MGNLLWMYHSDRLTLPGKNCLRIAFAAAVMGLAVWAVGPAAARISTGPVLSLALEILLGAAVYGLCLLGTGELKYSELMKRK